MASQVNVALDIVKGIGPVPGDSSSAEAPLDIINLLDVTSFAVQDNGWIPNLPQQKAQFSNIGDALIDYSYGRVTESMTVTATGATTISRYWFEKRLNQFAQAAADFHTTEWQVEPVYLRWWAKGAPGPQYALIYSINVAQKTDPMQPYNLNIMGFTIEREYGWRGIPPGANPKLWTLGGAFSSSNSRLYENDGNHLVAGTVQNRREWTSTSYNAFTSKNWLDIPASKIPGDLPALVCVGFTGSVGATYNPILARYAKTLQLPGTAGMTTLNSLTYNSGDGVTVSADTSLAADTGSVQNASGTKQRAVCTFGTTATYATRLSWTMYSAANRGRFAAFVRMRASAATCNFTVGLITSVMFGGTVLQPVTYTGGGSGGTSNTLGWSTVYLGTFSNPYGNARNSEQVEGNGQDKSANLSLYLGASRTSGTESLYICDLILIPIDEAVVQLAGIKYSPFGGTYVSDAAIYDNTGYMGHGMTADISAQYENYSGVPGVPAFTGTPEIRGGGLTLAPGVDNRLIVFNDVTMPSGSMPVWVNIVPRWSGIRDA